MAREEIREAYSPALQAAARPQGSAARQAWLVAVLTTIYTLNFVDRGALNLIVQPIKTDLHVTDLQMSYLLGLSFVALYSVCSIPAGYVADMVSRRLMIFFAVLFWSVMQVLCGLAGTYGQLFAGRVGLGLGEAALPPAAYSLLRDGIEPKNRGRAFSIYQMGPLLGTGVGALVGGLLYTAASHGAFRGLPLLGQLRPWQVVIAVPGLFGVLVALAMLTVREPPRDQPVKRTDLPTYREMLRFVGQHWRLYLPILAATTVLALATGWNAWMPAALNRIWGLTPGKIGTVTGPLNLILNPIAYVTIGHLMDRFTTPRRPDGMMRVAIAGTILNLPAAMAVLLAPSVGWMWIAYGASVLITGCGQVAVAAILADVTPGRMMGKVTSLQFLVGNILGLAMGPTLFALVAKLFTGPRAIAYSMLVCYPAIVAVTVLFMVITARELRRLKAAG
jgi:MFS family permease